MTRIRIAILAATLSLAGCGGASEEEKVREAFTEFTQAAAKGDYDTVCSRMTKALQDLAAQDGASCAEALKKVNASAENREELLKSKPKTVTINGDTAVVTVEPAQATNNKQTLTKVDGEWLIDVTK